MIASLFRMFGVTIILSVAGRAMAAPPPPPPPFIGEIAQRIVPTQTAESFDRYAETLADDLIVTVDGEQVAAGKAAWLAIERRRLEKVDRRVLGYVQGYDAIMVLDRFDDRSDLPTTPGLHFDPRYKIRAVQYRIGDDHLIHVIRIVQADGILQVAP